MLRRQLLAAALVAAATLAGSAGAVENPAKLDGAVIVTAKQASDLAAKGTSIIDVRSANEFAEGHIKGARNVPYKEKSEKKAGFDGSLDSFDLAKLPADKNAPIVMYCNGLDCWKSYKAATTAVKAGYKKVHWLRGGLPEWKAGGLALE